MFCSFCLNAPFRLRKANSIRYYRIFLQIKQILNGFLYFIACNFKLLLSPFIFFEYLCCFQVHWQGFFKPVRYNLLFLLDQSENIFLKMFFYFTGLYRSSKNRRKLPNLFRQEYLHNHALYLYLLYTFQNSSQKPKISVSEDR